MWVKYGLAHMGIAWEISGSAHVGKIWVRPSDGKYLGKPMGIWTKYGLAPRVLVLHGKYVGQHRWAKYGLAAIAWSRPCNRGQPIFCISSYVKYFIIRTKNLMKFGKPFGNVRENSGF
jgi:hypothetical protein